VLSKTGNDVIVKYGKAHCGCCMNADGVIYWRLCAWKLI